MDLQYLLPADDIGSIDHDMPVKPSWSEESGVEDLRPVGGGHDDDPCIGLETIHLRKELVESLFLFIVSAHRVHPPCLSKRIQFIDEDNTGRIGLGLGKEIPDSGCSHSDKHLHEIGTADGEERDIGLSSHCFGKEGLPCSGHPNEKHSLGNLTTETLKLSGSL